MFVVVISSSSSSFVYTSRLIESRGGEVIRKRIVVFLVPLGDMVFLV